MAKRRPKNRPNPTGRNNTSRFARLDFRLLISPAYRSLSPNARSLLIELAMLENGDNNGSLFLSVKDGAHRMGLADLTAASRAFDELQGMGFIVMTKDAHWEVTASAMSRARCWRLTWLSGPSRKLATWDFQEREPEPKTPGRKRMDRGLRALKAYRKARDENKMPVLDSNTLDPFGRDLGPNLVLDSATSFTENCDFSDQSIVLDSDMYSAVTMGKGNAAPLIGWWTNDRMAHASAWAAIINSALEMEELAA